MVIYGTRATGIGSFQVEGTKCKHCETTAPQDVHVFGRYAHVFWIPLFPVGKVAVAECTECKKTIKKKEFPNSLREQYGRVAQNYVKRPIWHWAGLGIIGLLAGLIGLSVAISTPDPREKDFDADIAMMTTAPTMESDSISTKLQFMFNTFISEEMEPETFEYFTKVAGNKALILVKIPLIKHLEKSERPKAIEWIEEFAASQPDLNGKELYIGIHGEYSMMVLKTPTEEDNSRLALDSPLYDFYGPAPVDE